MLKTQYTPEACAVKFSHFLVVISFYSERTEKKLGLGTFTGITFSLIVISGCEGYREGGRLFSLSSGAFPYNRRNLSPKCWPLLVLTPTHTLVFSVHPHPPRNIWFRSIWLECLPAKNNGKRKMGVCVRAQVKPIWIFHGYTKSAHVLFSTEKQQAF